MNELTGSSPLVPNTRVYLRADAGEATQKWVERFEPRCKGGVVETRITAEHLVRPLPAQQNRDESRGFFGKEVNAEGIGMIERLVEMPGRILHVAEEAIVCKVIAVTVNSRHPCGLGDPLFLAELRIAEDDRERVHIRVAMLARY